MKTSHKLLLAALVSTSLGAAAMPALADPGERGEGPQMAHFDGDHGHGMRGGPHGPGGPGFHGGPGGRFGGPMGGPGGGPGLEMVIERFDVNGDGQITKEEVTTVTADKVKTFDANGDGTLSLEEYRALWTDAMDRMIVRSFQFHDPDGDAKITLEEYSADFDKMFTRFDRNEDGTIAADEFGPGRGDGPDGPPRMGPGGPGMGPGGPGGPDDDAG